MVHWHDQWVEVFAFSLIVVGFVVSILLQSTFLSLLSVFLAGFLGGRMFYIKWKSEPILPTILILLGFLIGYLLGSFWVRRIWVFVFFGVGFAISYFLHKKQILVIFKNKLFIK